MHPSYSSSDFTEGMQVNRWNEIINQYQGQTRNLVTTRSDGDVVIDVSPEGEISAYVGYGESVNLVKDHWNVPAQIS